VDIRKFIVKRQTDLSVLVKKGTKDTPEVRRTASNGEINRELALLKRMFQPRKAGRPAVR
jgi:hypothetical protein